MIRRLISLFMACIMSFFLPQISTNGAHGVSFLSKELVTSVAPVLSYNEKAITKKEQLAAGAEYENQRALGQSGSGEEQEQARQDGTWNAAEQPENTKMDSFGADGSKEAPMQETDSQSQNEEKSTQTFQILWPDDTTVEEQTHNDTAVPDAKLLEKLNDFDYLIQNYYIVDSSTTIRSSDISAAELLAKDLTIKKEADGPQILIYHTHSQETYGGAPEGDDENSVVAVGEYMTKLLTEKYGFFVLHHTGEYDVNDRDHAYSNAAPSLKQLLEENPTIEVVIDLHRDSVPDESHLVTTIDGKKCARIMFFNGLCRTTARGELTKMQNPYLQDNLAFSLQMQLAAAEKYPDFTRKIYLKGYRYNMHMCPKSLLVEVGAQNNSLEEAMNAMEPLADLLAGVLQN